MVAMWFIYLFLNILYTILLYAKLHHVWRILHSQIWYIIIKSINLDIFLLFGYDPLSLFSSLCFFIFQSQVCLYTHTDTHWKRERKKTLMCLFSGGFGWLLCRPEPWLKAMKGSGRGMARTQSMKSEQHTDWLVSRYKRECWSCCWWY